MTDTAALAHQVLLQVADFLRKLPAEELEGLATGGSKLEVVPKGGRRPVARKSAPAALPRPASEILATARGIGDRAAVRRYLETDLKLTVPKLLLLADEWQVTVRKLKAEILNDLVEWLVGRTADSNAVTGGGGR